MLAMKALMSISLPSPRCARRSSPSECGRSAANVSEVLAARLSVYDSVYGAAPRCKRVTMGMQSVTASSHPRHALPDILTDDQGSSSRQCSCSKHRPSRVALTTRRKARLVLSEAPQKPWRSCCGGLQRSSDCRDRVPGIASVVLDAAPLLGPTISTIFGLLHLAFVAGLRSMTIR